MAVKEFKKEIVYDVHVYCDSCKKFISRTKEREGINSSLPPGSSREGYNTFYCKSCTEKRKIAYRKQKN